MGQQSCAFCGEPPAYVHPLDASSVLFRFLGKGYALPGAWYVCERCEALVADGDDGALLTLLGREGERADYGAVVLEVFRRADLGAERWGPETASS